MLQIRERGGSRSEIRDHRWKDRTGQDRTTTQPQMQTGLDWRGGKGWNLKKMTLWVHGSFGRYENVGGGARWDQSRFVGWA